MWHDFSAIQFPCLYSEDRSVYMLKLFWALNEMCISHLAQCLEKNIQSFIHSFNKYLSCTYYVSAYILVERDNLNKVYSMFFIFYGED